MEETLPFGLIYSAAPPLRKWLTRPTITTASVTVGTTPHMRIFVAPHPDVFVPKKIGNAITPTRIAKTKMLMAISMTVPLIECALTFMRSNINSPLKDSIYTDRRFKYLYVVPFHFQ